MTIIDKLKSLGYTTIDASWYDRVANWQSWYEGNVKNFHSYRVFNGQHSVKCQRYTLGMAKKVSEDWANLLMNEKVKITLEDDEAQEFIDEVFTATDFEVNANELQERGAALGTYAIVPRVTKATVNADGAIVDGGEIDMDFVDAEGIFPIAWKARDITECAFGTQLSDGKDKFLYMQIHVVEDGGYVIYNRMFRVNGGEITDADLSDVRGYENVPEKVITGSDTPQFVVGRLNIANNIEKNNPMGISVYANAIDVLKGVDICYDSYVNEFVLGKKRIMVKPSATKTLDGEDVFDPNDVCYYVLPEDITDGSIIQPIDMSLRTGEHTQGLQEQLNLLSAKVGFGEKHYAFDQGSVATATQIVSENSEMFRTIKKHEIVLESVLTELCRILLRMGNQYMNLGLPEDVEISIDFDDSIIEDKDAQFAKTLQLLAAGLMKPDEARSIIMNEDIETARAALPVMEEMVDEGQDEVE